MWRGFKKLVQLVAIRTHLNKARKLRTPIRQGGWSDSGVTVYKPNSPSNVQSGTYAKGFSDLRHAAASSLEQELRSAKELSQPMKTEMEHYVAVVSSHLRPGSLSCRYFV